jgi:hypothetical protein
VAARFTIADRCNWHGIDPFRYLAGVLRRLPTTPPDGLTEFVLDVWFQIHPLVVRKRAE